MPVGRAPLLIYDQSRYVRKQLGCIDNLQRLTEEDSIFRFDLYGCRCTKKQHNNTSSSEEKSTPVVTKHKRYRNKTVMTVHNVAA